MNTQNYLSTLHDILGNEISSNFVTFWSDYSPSNPIMLIPPFELIKKKLNGPFGHRLPRPGNPKGWLIEIEEGLPQNVKEVTLAHEMVHLSLDMSGYPMIAQPEGAPCNAIYDSIAAVLHSILVHPIIWARLKSYGFMVDDHILIKSCGQLNDLRKIRKYPSRRNSPAWEEWVLKYILARLEWGESERQEIYDLFRSRYSSIGDQGEKILDRLYGYGYSRPDLITPETASSAAEMILDRLKLRFVFTLPKIKLVKLE